LGQRKYFGSNILGQSKNSKNILGQSKNSNILGQNILGHPLASLCQYPKQIPAKKTALKISLPSSLTNIAPVMSEYLGSV
jgi:hypothetical protein